MAVVAQKIRNLLNGVSEQPPELRLPSQAALQENALSMSERGLRSRPPTAHVARLVQNVTGYDTALVHDVIRSEGEEYRVVIANGDLKVFDAKTGAEQVVYFPKGKDYLTSTTGFRAVTVGDYTFLVNRDKVVLRGYQKSAAPMHEAIVYVRQADYSTSYMIELDGTQVGIQTVDATQASARMLISTDRIASDLLAALQANNVIERNYTLAINGGTIYIARTDGRDFSISTSDGLADKGLNAVKGKIQSFADLPRRAFPGMIVEVAGAPGDKRDNYWVQYDDSATPGGDGVWRECPKPGTLVALDASTMPHALVRNGRLIDNLTHGGHPHIPAVSLGTQSIIEIPWDITTPTPPLDQPQQPPDPPTPPPPHFDFPFGTHGGGRRLTYPV